MTARVINDPSALGWEYDPDTGRWTWGGHSSSGGGGGGEPFPEAPVDGKQYARQDAGWAVIVHPEGGDGGGDVDLTGYATEEWVGDNYQVKGTYLTSETDPVFQASVAAGITQADINNWNSNSGGGGGGNDPRITDTQINNWDTSYNWGNHASEGYATQSWVSTNYQVKGNYLTSNDLSDYATRSWVSTNYQPKGSYLTSESDPTVPSWVKSITQNDINNWNSSSGGGDPFPWTGTTAQFNSSGENPAIKMRSGAGRGPEICWEHTNGQKKHMRLTGAGNLEVISSAYSGVIHTITDAGNVQATDFTATSDARLKDQIADAPSDVIAKLKGREWVWANSGSKGSGVVAQELEDAGLDHLVYEDPNGYKGVSYNGLIGYLIEEVKSLRAELEALK